MGSPKRAVLSRFAFVRREGARWVLESARSPARIELADAAAFAVIEALRAPHSPASLATAAKIPLATARRTFDALARAGFLSAAAGRNGGPTREDRDDALATWEFADLLLHSRSRAGRSDEPVGATFPFRESLPPAPATKPRMRGTRVRLPRPDIVRIAERDAPFTTVLERRRSARSFGRRVLTLEEISEFLYRAARVSAARDVPAAGYRTTRRPYPSGGACYPLEIYLATDRGGGLRAGLHHYDPAGHALTTLPQTAGSSATLLAEARSAVRVKRAPTALVILTARFHRVAWKYRGISYATVLKDVGVLLQTMHLVATAMGLAGSAVGCGNVSVLADALGVAIERESSVGEFLLGAPAHA